MRSLIVIAPIDYAPSVNLLIQSVNPSWGDDNLTVRLSANGQEPATHKGCCLASPSPSFVALLTAARAGSYAPDGYSTQDVQSLLSLLIIDDQDIKPPRAHWDAVLAANGLQEVQIA